MKKKNRQMNLGHAFIHSRNRETALITIPACEGALIYCTAAVLSHPIHIKSRVRACGGTSS